jgi:hypothetical protein
MLRRERQDGASMRWFCGRSATTWEKDLNMRRSHVDGEEAARPGKRMGARELTGSVMGEHAREGTGQMRRRTTRSKSVVCETWVADLRRWQRDRGEM